jgi:hypothetical protein
LSNYDSTKLWFAYFGFSSGETPDKKNMGSSLSVAGQQNNPKLLDQVRQLMRLRHYSLRTEEAYVGWIRRYICFTAPDA